MKFGVWSFRLRFARALGKIADRDGPMSQYCPPGSTNGTPRTRVEGQLRAASNAQGLGNASHS
jgi:hypothetical protein